MHVLVVGASGFTGGNISRELVSRGHTVTGLSRHAAKDTSLFRDYIEADFGREFREVLAEGNYDAVVIATKEDAEAVGEFSKVVAEITREASTRNARVGFVGGAGTLLLPSGVGRVKDQPDFPEAFRGVARSAELVLDALTQSGLKNWFFLSPPISYGAQVEVEASGGYTRGEDEALFRADGQSIIAGEDYAKAFVDELEHPQALGKRFTVVGL